MNKRWLLPALLLLSGGVAADQGVYTLEQLTQMALQTDPRISEREQLVASARALQREAKESGGVKVDTNSFLAIAPAVNGGLFEEVACDPSVVECKVRDDRFDLVQGLSLWTYLEFSVIKPLSTFGKVENFAEAARHNVTVKENDVRIQRGATMLDVRRAYYGHLASRSTVLFLTDVKRRVGNAETLVQDWLDQGEGNVRQSSLYAIQSANKLVSAYLAQADGIQKISLDGLKVLSGIGLQGELSLAEASLAPVPLPTYDLVGLQDLALQRRPEMRQVEAGLKARRALVEANKAMVRPNLYAGVAGVYSAAPGRDRLDNPYIYDPFNDYGVTPLLGLQWSWEPGVQSARVDQARAELSALIEKQSLARNGIPFQVAEKYHEMHAYHDSLLALEEGAKSARRWMVAAYTDFEAGLETTDKLVAAFQAYVLAYTEYLKTVYEYNMRVAQLDQVTGAYE
ncbi:MAG: TolC family protein [Gammaproteobacteria bacterium]|nr:TolC family protein [Gammaproteobacteria bacterium]